MRTVMCRGLGRFWTNRIAEWRKSERPRDERGPATRGPLQKRCVRTRPCDPRHATLACLSASQVATSSIPPWPAKMTLPRVHFRAGTGPRTSPGPPCPPGEYHVGLLTARHDRARIVEVESGPVFAGSSTLLSRSGPAPASVSGILERGSRPPDLRPYGLSIASPRTNVVT